MSDPESIVRDFMSKMERLDYDAALELVADDVEYTNMPMGTLRGPDGIRSVLEPFFAPTVTNEWVDRKSTRLNSSHVSESRMPSSA